MNMSSNTALGILTAASDLTGKVINSFDEEKHANAVMKLYGSDPNHSTIEVLIKMIVEDTELSSNDKYERLLAIAKMENDFRDREFEHKIECARALDEGFEKRGKFVLKLVFGVLSGGVTLIPDGYHFFKGDNDDNFFSNLMLKH